MSARTTTWGLLRGLLGLLALALAWQWFATSGLYSPGVTPGLGAVADSLLRKLRDGELALDVLATFGRVLFGLAASAVISIPLAVMMGRYRIANRMCGPLISFLMPIPSLAIAPLLVTWLGIGNAAVLVVVTYASAFPWIYSVKAGVDSINQAWIKSAQAMGADRRTILRKVVLPGVSPYMLAGLRLAFGRAWVAVIGGELLANPTHGLGIRIYDANEFLDTKVMIGAIITIGLFGVIVNRYLIRLVERRTIVKWGMALSRR